MDSPSEAAAGAAPLARTFSQVLFSDIPHSYPPSTPITCRYTLTAAHRPHPRDWVGIFKVGWSSAKDYHTFVWAEPCLEAAGEQLESCQAIFNDYYLPKDEIEFYQFCYVDNTGQVRGASTPFCFKSREELSVESGSDDDLLVITTQEQVEQSVREKAELQKELDQIKEENETLKSVLQKERHEAATLKAQKEQKEKERGQLVGELEQLREQHGKLKSTLEQKLQEMNDLKEELLVQTTKQMEIQQHAATTEQSKRSESLSSDGASSQNEKQAQEKYDQAVTKINQLKDERKELMERIDGQSEEISKLNSKLRAGEWELLKMRDGIQLLQVDLHSSKEENKQLSAELGRLKSLMHDVDELKQQNQELMQQNQELIRRLSQQETRQRSPHVDCDQDEVDTLRAQSQALDCQLQEAQARLVTEREATAVARRRAEFLDGELQQIRAQIESLGTSFEQEQRKSNKMELQLREALEAIGDKESIIEEKEHMMRLVRQENEELTRENQGLKTDIEGLRRVYSQLHEDPDANVAHTPPGAASPARDSSAAVKRQGQETPHQSDDLYEAIESVGEPDEERSLVCRHCHESFPGITKDELEQHEQSHRVCPFCTMICDTMAQSVFEDHVYGHEV